METQLRSGSLSLQAAGDTYLALWLSHTGRSDYFLTAAASLLARLMHQAWASVEGEKHGPGPGRALIPGYAPNLFINLYHIYMIFYNFHFFICNKETNLCI